MASLNSPTDGAQQTVLDMVDAANAIERRLGNAVTHIKGISFAEYRLLDALRRNPSGKASRVMLAELVHLSPSGVTRALKPLEKLGFVTTERNERDARQALATLTPQGHELMNDATGVVGDTLNAMFEQNQTSPSQCDDALATLRALARS